MNQRESEAIKVLRVIHARHAELAKHPMDDDEATDILQQLPQRQATERKTLPARLDYNVRLEVTQ